VESADSIVALEGDRLREHFRGAMTGPRPEMPMRHLSNTGLETSASHVPQQPRPHLQPPTPALVHQPFHFVWPPQGNPFAFQVVHQPFPLASAGLPLSAARPLGQPIPPSVMPQVRPMLVSQAPPLQQKPASSRGLCTGCRGPLKGHCKFTQHKKCPLRPCEKCGRPYSEHGINEAGPTCRRVPTA
jgi:hypothetical protein